MEARKELAALIKRTRLDSGLKQEVFAREVGVVAAHLSRLEHGQGLPSIQLIQKIADRFGADRSRMLRLLRTIKGFEVEDDPRRAARGVRVPIVPAAAVPRWIAEFLDGRWMGADLPTEPVTREMSRDRRAFWVPATGVTMCGGTLLEWDLLLVEPSHPPVEGRPALVVLDGEVHVRRWRELQGHVLLEPICDDQPAIPSSSPEAIAARGGAFRIAGVRPCFRSFLGHDGKGR